MAPRKLIYEGKAKKLFEGPEAGTIIQHFKDDATAFNNQKKGTISGKGVMNNRISEYLMTRIAEMGIPTHFIKTLNMREQLVRAVQIVPLEIIIRNVAAGSFAKRFGISDGKVIGHPLIEYCFKNDTLGDPFVTEEHIFAFGWATPSELDEIRMYSFRINDFLSGLFMGVGIRLVDFKLEFGRVQDGDREYLVLADEISPDNCRLWDVSTGYRLDKDRFRQDLGGVENAYQEVAKRLGVLPQSDNETSYVIQVNPRVSKAKKKTAKKPVKKVVKKAAKPKTKAKAKKK